MRKRAVVVTIAVSAVLAGGIMVATTAGAGETPRWSPAPSSLVSDRTAVPQLPPDYGVPATTGTTAVPPDPAASAGDAAPAVDPTRPGTHGYPAATPKPAEPADPVPDVTVSPTRRAVDPVRARPADDPAPAGGPAPAVRPARKAAVRPVGRPRPAAARPNRPRAQSGVHRTVTAGWAISIDPQGSVQQQALDMVNGSRRRGGCDELTVDRRLVLAATRHAQEMARRGYFSHEDARGRQAGDRVQDAGYRWARFGENIARGQNSVAEVIESWMRSPEHRENIMDCRLREVGVGLAFGPDRTPYWVQDFGTPQ